jgi:4-hydroxyproline epimerase
MQRIAVIDSHTAGEPTRVVLSGGPALRGARSPSSAPDFALDHDGFRAAVANEPRGQRHDGGRAAGAARGRGCATGMIFFNNDGTMGMCGHGTIGVVATLAHLGRIGQGRHRLETPVGVVEAELHADGRVTVYNVPSRRHAADVTVDVPGLGPGHGRRGLGRQLVLPRRRAQFAREAACRASRWPKVEALTDLTWRIRLALEAPASPERDGAAIDHIELFGPARAGRRLAQLRAVPGPAYDRSPCGTGTSAKLACLAADGLLAPVRAGCRKASSAAASRRAGSRWRVTAGEILPAITGRAWITAEATLLRADDDPFRDGIRA